MKLLRVLLAALAAAPASAQTRALVAVPMETAVPVLSGPSASAAALSVTAPSLSAASLTPSLAAPKPSVAPALAVALKPAASAPDAPKPSDQLAAIGATPEEAALWTGAVAEGKARSLLRGSHWQTTKFFFGSRSKLLHQMVREQEKATAPEERSVKNLEGMWLDWRTKAYSGRVLTAGFVVADRATIRKEAIKLWDKYYPKDPAAKAAFLRYLDRVDAVVPRERPSYYRKKAFGPFYETPNEKPERLVARLDAMLGEDQLAAIAAHRAGRQQDVLTSFKTAVLKSIVETNRSLPQGRKIIAMALLGSYSIGQSGPSSDVDYQLITQDGGLSAIKPFAESLDKNWTENRLKDIEGFASTLPPAPSVVKESFPEGYLIISPDPAAVAALSKDSFAPKKPTSWDRVRGKIFGAVWKGWVWSYFRLADLRARLSPPRP